LPFNHAQKEDDQHNRRDDCGDVHDAPEALPSFALRVVEDLFHQVVGRISSLLHKAFLLFV
jgi:hypothetical protein